MRTLFLTVLLGAVGALANKEACSSGKFTTTGECCKQCQPGEGVIKPCGATQTVCAPCLDSETFAENLSHTETCQPCTRCVGLLRMQTPCTDSNDAICVCDYGYYLNELSSQCQSCTKCPEGQGMLYSCEHDRDTVCEECTRDTYSDQESSREPCLPCTICDEDDELEIQACNSISDTVCQDLNPPLFSSISPPPSGGSSLPSFTDDDALFPYGPTETATTTTTTSTIKFIGDELNKNLIPIYCSILAAVVVGLVAFIIFKRWNSCKQNKQGANNCTANQNQTPSPEGEKLHSDSGISVDSQSLQEQQGQGQTQAQTVVTVDEEPCLLLPLHTREEVEKLLYRGGEGEGYDHTEDRDWCSLAGLLGYQEERIATFRQQEHPVRALLSDWASQDCASLDTLCTALCKINREDIAQSLVLSPNTVKPTATSAV
ncbi:nerve growth factor receptor b [Oncorhynchus kisutch]|uniref:Nerve growth factor receptor n=1 Tax=Oncorhynchus kisutch TaxID=8019 RepID=A0A8C7MMS4_ONCKI|nr:tumor necrosis factor receptor superfamily member 16 [Oncorhynchus kisutch]